MIKLTKTEALTVRDALREMVDCPDEADEQQAYDALAIIEGALEYGNNEELDFNYE